MSVISKRYWYLAIEKLKWDILILQWFRHVEKSMFVNTIIVIVN
jgi:hypothetical protein